MIAVMLLAAGAGVGLFLAVVSVVGTGLPSLAHRLVAVEAATPRPIPPVGPGDPSADRPARFGRAGAPGTPAIERAATAVARRLGDRLIGPALAQDLTVLGMDPHAYTVGKVSRAVLALLIGPPILVTVAVWTGLPVLSAGYLTLTLAAALVVVPDRRVRRAAAARRRDFTTSFASYLDLVALRAAASSGLHEALRDAAEVGDGPGWDQLRLALTSARLRGQTPAAGLGRLGADLEISELVDLAAQLYGISESGAQVAATLRAKSAALREADRTRAAGTAAERSNSMVLGHLLLAAGYLVLLLWPAMTTFLRFGT